MGIENKRLRADVELKNGGNETEEGNEVLMFEKEVIERLKEDHPFTRLEQESVSLLWMTQ